MYKHEWLMCPICENKTRVKINENTVLENFPLYCPKCKKEKIVNVKKLKLIVLEEPDAETQSR